MDGSSPPFDPEDSEHPGVRVYGLDELGQVGACEWVVEDMVEAGEVTVLYGPPKCGKTLAVLDMALHVAAGLEWNGQRVVGPAPVVYAALEHRRHVQGRVKGWQARHGAVDLSMFGVVTDGPEAGPDRWADDVRQAAQTRFGEPPKLVVVDTIAGLAGPLDYVQSEREAREIINEALEPLTDDGIGVVVVAHARKDGGGGPLGSVRLAGTPTSVLKMDKRDDLVTLRVEYSNAAPEDQRFSWRIVGDFDQPRLEPTEAVPADGVARAADGKTVDDVLRVLKANPGMKKAKLLEEVGGNRKAANSLVAEAVDDGRIVVRDAPGGGQMHYLAEDAP